MSVLLPDESGEEDKQGTQHISVTPLDLEQPVHTMYIELGTSLKKTWMSEQYWSINLHDTYNFIMKHVTKSMLFIQIIVKKILLDTCISLVS